MIISGGARFDSPASLAGRPLRGAPKLEAVIWKLDFVVKSMRALQLAQRSASKNKKKPVNYITIRTASHKLRASAPAGFMVAYRSHSKINNFFSILIVYFEFFILIILFLLILFVDFISFKEEFYFYTVVIKSLISFILRKFCFVSISHVMSFTLTQFTKLNCN